MRNFLHNISDIVLAIVIVAVATGIIFWRMQVIMAYPEKIAAQQAAQQPKVEQQQAEADDNSTEITLDDNEAESEDDDSEAEK